MAVNIEYVPEQRNEVQEVVSSPKEDDTVLAEHGNKYVILREQITIEEQYIVRTWDGAGKSSHTYWIEQNEDGDWYVRECRKSPDRGHTTVKKGGNLSTKKVREAMSEHGIELVN